MTNVFDFIGYFSNYPAFDKIKEFRVFTKYTTWAFNYYVCN